MRPTTALTLLVAALAGAVFTSLSGKTTNPGGQAATSRPILWTFDTGG